MTNQTKNTDELDKKIIEILDRNCGYDGDIALEPAKDEIIAYIKQLLEEQSKKTMEDFRNTIKLDLTNMHDRYVNSMVNYYEIEKGWKDHPESKVLDNKQKKLNE